VYDNELAATGFGSLAIGGLVFEFPELMALSLALISGGLLLFRFAGRAGSRG
jgi:hypothetical protein